MINVGSGRKSYFPKKYQDRKVITFDEYANYKINSLILGAYEITKPKPTNSPIPTATPDTPGPAPPSTGRQRQISEARTRRLGVTRNVRDID